MLLSVLIDINPGSTWWHLPPPASHPKYKYPDLQQVAVPQGAYSMPEGPLGIDIHSVLVEEHMNTMVTEGG